MITFYIACALWGAVSFDLSGGRYRYGIPLMLAGTAILVWLRSEGL